MLLYCLLLFSFISVGVVINDGLFQSKDCSTCDNSLLLKLIAFWSGHVILGTSVTFLSFSRYNNFLWLLWCLRFDFLNLLVFCGWSKIVILSLWYFDCCFLKTVGAEQLWKIYQYFLKSVYFLKSWKLRAEFKIPHKCLILLIFLNDSNILTENCAQVSFDIVNMLPSIDNNSGLQAVKTL